MALTTEYLVIIDQNTDDALYRLCESTADFERLLGTCEDFDIESGYLRIKSGETFHYTIDLRDVQHKSQRCFHLCLRCDDDSEIEEYNEARRNIRRLVGQSRGVITETIWDDVSLFYSNKSYPIIHRIENMMRKLISYFMLTTVGKDWLEEASPDKFRDTVQRSKRKQEYTDALQQVDFIDLADLLFKPYSPKDPQDLTQIIKAVDDSSALDLDQIKYDYAPRSNWERYFSAIVQVEDAYLGNRWRRLYDLRCKVAHNAIVTRADYNDIARIASELEQPLQRALDGLSEVTIPDADREQIVESVAVARGEAYRRFTEQWRTLEQTLLSFQSELGESFGQCQNLTPELIAAYVDNEIIDSETANTLKHLMVFRNVVAHDVTGETDETELLSRIGQIDDFLRLLRRDWRDEIEGALRALGGEATLKEIYQYLEEHGTRDRTENWKAIVRYTINRNSADTETFKYGGTDVFRHVSRGRWALRHPSG